MHVLLIKVFYIFLVGPEFRLFVPSGPLATLILCSLNAHSVTGSGRTTSIKSIAFPSSSFHLGTPHVGLSLGRLMSLERVCTSHAHRHGTFFVCGRTQGPRPHPHHNFSQPMLKFTANVYNSTPKTPDRRTYKHSHPEPRSRKASNSCGSVLFGARPHHRRKVLSSALRLSEENIADGDGSGSKSSPRLRSPRF